MVPLMSPYEKFIEWSVNGAYMHVSSIHVSELNHHMQLLSFPDPSKPTHHHKVPTDLFRVGGGNQTAGWDTLLWTVGSCGNRSEHPKRERFREHPGNNG